MSGRAIAAVRGRRVWDSRGRPTVEADVALDGGASGRAIAPAGASRGSGEALVRRDGGRTFGGYGVGRALAAIREVLEPGLRGLDATAQGAVDAKIAALDGTPNKRRLGGNATIAVSMAVAHAAAEAAAVPLWRHLAGIAQPLLPLPEIQLFGGGAHAARALDLQDIMVMPLGAASFAEALEWVAEIYRAAGERLAKRGQLAGVADEGGYWPQFKTNEEAIAEAANAIVAAGLKPGRDAALSLDIAATQLWSKPTKKYRLARKRRALDREGLLSLYESWIESYPIVSIEDPFAETDKAGFKQFTHRFGRRLQVIGDDLLVTNAARIEAAARNGLCNAVLVKPNQAGTLSEARAALVSGKAAGWGTIVSARSGESEDTTIAHLAVGWHAGQLKVGSFARSERMAKWNEVLRIEEALGRDARFAGRAALPVKV